MQGGGAISQQIIKSDFLLVQLGGDGEGCMPFRDAYEVKGRKLRERDDRLLKLFTSNDKGRFEKAAAFSSDSAKHNLGNVARTINIPTAGDDVPASARQRALRVHRRRRRNDRPAACCERRSTRKWRGRR